jgi:16S rRNA (guanine527-N7)-methyltransferase
MTKISEYFPELGSKQIEKFALLEQLYPEWNEKINVISRKDIENLFERHILHSLAIAKMITIKSGCSVMDVGTGGGFPGIPLAIFFPNVKFYLIDSIGKKINVVKEIIQILGLDNVTAEQKRAENVKETFDFIVSRAVTAFPQFYNITHKNISETNRNTIPNGIIYLKGGDFDEEIAPYKGGVKLYQISEMFEGEFFETKKIIHVWKSKQRF